MGLFGVFNRQWFLVAIAFYIYAMAGAEYRMLQEQEFFRSGGDGSRVFRGNNGRRSWEAPDEVANIGDDEVVVSPPPYRKGPVERVDIHREKRGNARWFSIF